VFLLPLFSLSQIAVYSKLVRNITTTKKNANSFFKYLSSLYRQEALHATIFLFLVPYLTSLSLLSLLHYLVAVIFYVFILKKFGVMYNAFDE